MVRPSLARIGAPGDGYATDRDAYWGSGFFIAPGWLLTCAHVVGRGEPRCAEGERPERELAGAHRRRRLGSAAQRPPGPPSSSRPGPRARSRRATRGRSPDLALVRVTGADAVRCLWLGDREAGPRSPLGLYGWSVQTGELGIRHGTGELAGSDARALLLAGSLPIGGLSGGPVLDLRHGSVIGVIRGAGARRRRRRPGHRAVRTAGLPRGRAHGARGAARARPAYTPRLLDLPRRARTGPPSRPRCPGHLPRVPASPPACAPGSTAISPSRRRRPGAGESSISWRTSRRRCAANACPRWCCGTYGPGARGAALLYGLRMLEPGGGGTPVDLDAVLLYAWPGSPAGSPGHAPGRWTRGGCARSPSGSPGRPPATGTGLSARAIRALLDGMGGMGGMDGMDGAGSVEGGGGAEAGRGFPGVLPPRPVVLPPRGPAGGPPLERRCPAARPRVPCPRRAGLGRRAGAGRSRRRAVPGGHAGTPLLAGPAGARSRPGLAPAPLAPLSIPAPASVPLPAPTSTRAPAETGSP